MRCPYCDSENVTIRRERVGTTSRSTYVRAGTGSTIRSRSGNRNYSSTIQYRNVALCKNCGQSWSIEENNSSNVRQGNPDSFSLGTSIVLILCAFLIITFLGHILEPIFSPEKVAESDAFNAEREKNWADSYTPIEAFDYQINDDGLYIVYLKQDTPRSQKVNLYIAPKYSIDGQEYPVYKVGDVLDNKYTKSLIISEGIKIIDGESFKNAESLKLVYLPSTISEDYPLVFHDSKGFDTTVYYGGSEESFYQHVTTDRGWMHLGALNFDTSLDDLLKEEE